MQRTKQNKTKQQQKKIYNRVAKQNRQNIHKINTMALLYVIDSSSQHV